MSEPPFITVVIPVWNSPDLIARCLAAVEEQSYPRNCYEVLVVDNGSTDETADVARSFPFVRLLSEPIASSYRARNLGLKAARGEYVAFTDADCIPDPGWLAAAGRAAREHPHAAVLAGHVEMFRAGPTGSVACEKYEYAFGFDQARNVAEGVCVTANWMSPRSLLLEFGGFDDGLKSGGDWDLSRRMRAAGLPLVYVADMRVNHPVRASLGMLIARRRRMTGGNWQTSGRRWRFFRCSAAVLRRCGARIIKTASNSRLSLADRLRVIGVVVTLSVVAMAELVRLACGGEARRA